MQPVSGIQRPDLLTSLMNMSLVLHLPRDMHLCRSSSNGPRLPSFLYMPQNLQVLVTFSRMQNPLRVPHKTTLQRPRVIRYREFSTLLTSKYASRHKGAHFLKMSTAKSALNPFVFLHSWRRNVLRATAACTFSVSELAKVLRGWRALCSSALTPQRRALFQRLNFQKWSEPASFFTLVTWKFARATMASLFSTSQLPKMLWTWYAL